jgi:hypothetical protein
MQPDNGKQDDRKDTLRSSPYGPHPDTVDTTSGGADSSPGETMSSDERHHAAGRKPGQQPGAAAARESQP